MDDHGVEFVPLKVMSILQLDLDRFCQPDLEERQRYFSQAEVKAVESKKSRRYFLAGPFAYRGVDFDTPGSLDIKPEAIQRHDEIGRKRG